jgi:hypothetical protein
MVIGILHTKIRRSMRSLKRTRMIMLRSKEAAEIDCKEGF